MAGVETGGQGGLDERFRAIDPIVRPYAVKLGYEEWGDLAGHLDSVVWEDLFDHEMAGNISAGDVQPVAATTPRVVRAACELGYISRLHTGSLVVDSKLGDGISDIVLGDSYRVQQTKMQQAHSKALRTVPVDSPEWEQMLALGDLIGVRPRVAAQAFLWGRLGTQLFLHGNVDTPSTVQHHGELITTDATLEAKKVEAHMDDFTIEDPQYGLLEKIGLWREGDAHYRWHMTSTGHRNLSRYDMGRWLREGRTRIKVREGERERFRQELRANPVEIED